MLHDVIHCMEVSRANKVIQVVTLSSDIARPEESVAEGLVSRDVNPSGTFGVARVNRAKLVENLHQVQEPGTIICLVAEQE